MRRCELSTMVTAAMVGALIAFLLLALGIF